MTPKNKLPFEELQGEIKYGELMEETGLREEVRAKKTERIRRTRRSQRGKRRNHPSFGFQNTFHSMRLRLPSKR